VRVSGGKRISECLRYLWQARNVHSRSQIIQGGINLGRGEMNRRSHDDPLKSFGRNTLEHIPSVAADGRRTQESKGNIGTQASRKIVKLAGCAPSAPEFIERDQRGRGVSRTAAHATPDRDLFIYRHVGATVISAQLCQRGSAS
jgi:hypothetical protein